MAVWKPTPITADVTKIAGYVRIRILVNRWFLAIHTFYATTFYTPDALTRSRAVHVCGALRLVGVTTMLGVSLQARRDTTQVMLGLSLQARWDTTLVRLILIVLGRRLWLHLYEGRVEMHKRMGGSVKEYQGDTGYVPGMSAKGCWRK